MALLILGYSWTNLVLARSLPSPPCLSSPFVLLFPPFPSINEAEKVWGVSEYLRLPYTGGARNVHLGAIVQGVWGRKKLKQFAYIGYRFDSRNHQNLKNFTQFTSWFLTSVFHSGGGLSGPFGAKPPSPCLTSPLQPYVSFSAFVVIWDQRASSSGRQKMFGPWHHGGPGLCLPRYMVTSFCTMPMGAH